MSDPSRVATSDPAKPPVLSYAAPPPRGRLRQAALWASTACAAIVPAILGVSDFRFALVYVAGGLTAAALVFALVVRLGADQSPWKRCGNVLLAVAVLEMGLVGGRCVWAPPNARGRPPLRVRCNSNLRIIGQAILMYANENKGAYPPSLPVLLATQDFSSSLLVCPATCDTPAKGANLREVVEDLVKNPGHCSYVYTGAGLTSTSSAGCIAAYEPLQNHGGAGMNVLFGDLFVDWVEPAAAQYLLAELAAGFNPPRPAAGIAAGATTAGAAAADAAAPKPDVRQMLLAKDFWERTGSAMAHDFDPATAEKIRAIAHRPGDAALRIRARKLLCDLEKTARVDEKFEARQAGRALAVAMIYLEAHLADATVAKFAPQDGFSHLSVSFKDGDAAGVWILLEWVGAEPGESCGLNLRVQRDDMKVTQVQHWGKVRGP